MFGSRLRTPKHAQHLIEQLTKGPRSDPLILDEVQFAPPFETRPRSFNFRSFNVLPPEVFAALRVTEPGAGGEIQLTDALVKLVEDGVPVHGVVFSGRRYDTGDRLDYLKAIVQLAVERKDLGPQLRPWLRNFVADLPAEGASPA